MNHPLRLLTLLLAGSLAGASSGSTGAANVTSGTTGAAHCASDAAPRVPTVGRAGAACPVATGVDTPLRVQGVPDGAPFRVSATATDRALVVVLDFDPEWHAYSRDIGGGRPVVVGVEAGSNFTAAGPLEIVDDGDGKLEGQARLTLPLMHDGTGFELEATLDVQVCDALECLEPMTLTLSGKVDPLRVLLVVAKEDERAERIRKWLDARGFATGVATYSNVDLAAADAHDVVIADSEIFQKHGVGLDVVARFPRTTTPIIAVGFIGTELCEGHGLAMTSGYI